MKKATALLLSVLLLCCMSMAAFAEEATITTTVPASHTITVAADGADVFYNGELGSQFTVDRLSEPRLLIRAVSGREITQISLNGADTTAQVQGGYYTLGPICADQTLTVVTQQAPPTQGKTYAVQGTVKQNGQPAAGITTELRSTLQTSVTDATGRVSFRDIECGRHSLTALENGRVIGYVEFVLAEGSAAGVSFANGIYTVTASQSEIGIDLTLEVAANGTIRITGVAGIQASAGPGGAVSPQTGDSAALLLWLALMALACAGLYSLARVWPKRKNQ